MTITSLPLIGHLYLPFLLTSIIIGMIILILFEKRKSGRNDNVLKKNITQGKSVNNGVLGNYNGKSTADTKTIKCQDSENGPNKIGSKSAQNSITELGGQSESSQIISNQTNDDKSCSQTEENSQDSTSCGSSSDDDTVKPRKHLSNARKKHSCSGAKTCSEKKNVSEVIIVTDIDENQVKVGLQDFEEKFKTGGLTCTIRPSLEAQHSLLNMEPAQLGLFMVTSHEYCEELHNSILRIREKSDCVPAFLYSISCIKEASSEEISESAERLNVALSDLGGTEWLPLTYITDTEEMQDPSVLSIHQYISKVLNKVKKMSKKCCGTSCSSKKAVDIEDLAASLLPAPVKT